MKCEIERMEIIYTFYFFAFFEKVIKKLLTFCYWSYGINYQKTGKDLMSRDELADRNPKLALDIEKFVSHRLVLKKNEEVEVFEADAIG